MSVIVAQGIVEVSADAKAVPREVAKDIENGKGQTSAAGKSMGTSIFKGVLGAWAAIGGATAIVGFFTGAVSGASSLNETMNKSAAIFGAQQDSMVKWSSGSAKAFGLSQSAALDAAASFGDMFTQIGFTGDASAKMSQSVVQSAADLGSFSDLDTADVMERLSGAFRGEYDSLQKVIPNINAHRVEQEALAATGKKTTSELTAQDKAAAVLAIVHKDGARAMGDFAKTSDSAANMGKTVTASMEDQQNKLGTQLLPMWQGFLGFLNDVAIPGLAAVVDWTSKNGETIAIVATTLGAAALAYGIVTTAIGLHTAFVVASAAAEGGMTVAQWALNAAMTANPIGLIIAAIVLLVGAIIWIATQTTWFQDIWQGAMDGIAVAINWVWTSVIKPVGDFFVGMFTNIGNTVSDVFGGISGFIGSAFQSVLNVVRGPINGILGLVNSVIRGINSISVTIPDWVPFVGGQTWGIHLPTLPMLARGSHNAPDTFIAGEDGPELITGAGGSRVYSNSETRAMLTGTGSNGGNTFYVTLDANNVRKFTDIVKMVEALPQVARTGRIAVGG